MAKQRNPPLLAPLALVVLGVGWLLSSLGVAPGINWVWVLALGGLGLTVLLVSGIDKASIVCGPLLLVASVLSILRQSGRLSLDVEVPLLVIVAGVLLMIARLPSVPPPAWLDDAEPKPN